MSIQQEIQKLINESRDLGKLEGIQIAHLTALGVAASIAPTKSEYVGAMKVCREIAEEYNNIKKYSEINFSNNP